VQKIQINRQNCRSKFRRISMIDDVGEITAQSIYEFFRQPQTIDLINKLKEPE